MSHKILYILISVFLVVSTLYFAAINTANISCNFIGQKFDVPLAWIVIKLYILGGVTTLFLLRLRRREEKSEQKQLEWKAQDAKLQAEIQNDTVKLLEAKIATLETALDKALKKKG
ncbi:MAG: hypothetical protein HY986_23395 [Candidatus Melainabacteria bacterium]|nr:hypothetical protein [Candidatus Melainabacteria bacterium]